MNDNANTQQSAIDSETMEAIKDLAEIEQSIYREQLLSKEYFLKCANDIKKWDKKDLVNLCAHSVPHRLPFKVRFRNFWNKLFKTFGYGRPERFV